jgi:N-acyl-L-homoserine lactone synthetase
MTTGEKSPWVPVTFRVADVQDVEAVERCRYDVYTEQGFIAPENHPDGRERDDYDAHAVTAIATAGPSHDVIGTVRLLLSERGPLPITAPPHSIRVDTGILTAEISRLCVRREFRHGRVGIGLVRVLYHVIEQRFVETMYAILDERLLQSLGWIGIPFQSIGPPRPHMGMTVPCVCAVADVVPALRRNVQANLLGVTWLFEKPCPERLVL